MKITFTILILFFHSFGTIGKIILLFLSFHVSLLNTTGPLNEMRVCLYCYELITKTVTGDKRPKKKKKTSVQLQRLVKFVFCCGNHIWSWSHHLCIIMFLCGITALVRSPCTQNSFQIQYKTADMWGVRTAVGVNSSLPSICFSFSPTLLSVVQVQGFKVDCC